ncbi:hypothetical protein FGO68_gene12040 [Halteria grandinella]|uniref:Uncharacterized protein n=1 Tax=Halteria grandinella TaxID=5974 RepID=A0A8J8SU99_HALGN|nr:hypothetical protein FGO68_gene12040 [Halteria grandinella]
MQRVALIELRSEEGLVPSILSDYFGAISSQRIRGDLCLTQTSASPSDLLCAKREFRNRIAIGAEEVWELFPEARVIFTAVVERVTLAGKFVTEIPLGDVVAGDRLMGETIFLYDSIGMRAPPAQFATKEKLDVSKIDLADFSFLRTNKSEKQYCLNGKEILFCRIFSIFDCEDQFFPGFSFISTRELIENSDYKLIFKNISEQRKINGKSINTIDEEVLASFLPEDISMA